MTERVYTSAMGKPIDMGALAIKNQNMPAVGNMKVDASGKPLKPVKRAEEPRPAVAQVQAARVTNVQRVPVDATSADARLRLAREAEEHARRIEAERIAHEAEQARFSEPALPEPVVLELEDSSLEVIADDATESASAMMFSAEDPLALELPEPASEPEPPVPAQPSGLAAAVERARSRRGAQ